MFSREPIEFFEQLFAALCEDEFGMTTVLLASLTLDQPSLGEFIDQHHHAAGQDAQLFREVLLIAGWSRGDEPEDPRVARSDAQHRNPLTEPVGGMRSKLRKQEGRATRARFAGIHKCPIITRNVAKNHLQKK